MDTNLLLRLMESGCLLIMAVWTLSSVLYALPLPALRRRLRRFNQGLWFANWTVFGAGRHRASISRYVLRYREGSAGEAGCWVEAIRGRRWVWHAFLWQPDRRLADRLQRIGQEIAAAAFTPADAARVFTNHRDAIVAHLETEYPRTPGVEREVELIERRSVVGADAPGSHGEEVGERVLLAFALSPDERRA